MTHGYRNIVFVQLAILLLRNFESVSQSAHLDFFWESNSLSMSLRANEKNNKHVVGEQGTLNGKGGKRYSMI